MGTALFGGTAEYIALWFKDRSAENGFYVYITVVMALGFLVYRCMPDTQKHSQILED